MNQTILISENEKLLITEKAVNQTDIQNVGTLIISDKNISLTAWEIKLLSKNKIRVLFIDKTDFPYAVLESTQQELRPQLEKAQLNLISSISNQIARNLVLMKVENQLNLLKYFLKYERQKSHVMSGAYDKLLISISSHEKNILNLPTELPKSEFGEKILIEEALAAKSYWQGISWLLQDKIPFYTRAHDEADLFNQVFNLGYHFLYAEIWHALVVAGLNPYFGFLHHRVNQPSLVCDFIEPFRQPIVDRALVAFYRKKKSVEFLKYPQKMNREIYTRIRKEMEKKIKYHGEFLSFKEIICAEAIQLANKIQIQQEYRPFKYRWSNNY